MIHLLLNFFYIQIFNKNIFKKFKNLKIEYFNFSLLFLKKKKKKKKHNVITIINN